MIFHFVVFQYIFRYPLVYLVITGNTSLNPSTATKKLSLCWQKYGSILILQKHC